MKYDFVVLAVITSILIILCLVANEYIMAIFLLPLCASLIISYAEEREG